MAMLSFCARIKLQEQGFIQTGRASWYGPGFHGKQTSNQEVFNMYEMTAAHRTLPFGTYVAVTNLKNGRSATVRINDRGPFVKDRIIDLSYAAARILDMLDDGVIPVRIEVMGANTALQSRGVCVQVGSFVFRKNAETLRKRISSLYPEVYIAVFKTHHQTYYRVRIKAADKKDALGIAQNLKENGFTVLVLDHE